MTNNYFATLGSLSIFKVYLKDFFLYVCQTSINLVTEGKNTFRFLHSCQTVAVGRVISGRAAPVKFVSTFSMWAQESLMIWYVPLLHP